MEENKKNALISLTGGLGIVALLGGIFNLYPVTYGLLGALILGVTSGVIKGNWSAILGTVGLIVLLSGILGLFAFVYGLLGAILIWVIAGSIREYCRELNNGESPN